MKPNDTFKTRRTSHRTTTNMRARPPMKNILVLLAATLLIAACSPPSDLQYLALPTAPPTHIRTLNPHDDQGPYIVTVWGIPVVLADDFVPG